MNFELERRRMMMAQKAAEPVSYGWIRNSGKGAYIDTGIIPNQDTRVVVRARGVVPGGAFIFGARNGFASNTFTLVATDSQLTGALRLDYNTQQVGTAFAPGMFFFEHEYDMNRNRLYIDGVQVASTTAATFTPNLNLYLFGVNTNGTLSPSYHPFEIATVQIYQSDILVMDLVANEAPVGFYDRVSGRVLTNSGAGSLAYFAAHPNDDLCTPLEYVSSASSPTGFDSGVYATRGLFVTAVFRLDPDTLNWQSIIGDRPSSGYDFDLSFGTNTVPNSQAYHRVNGGSNTTSPSGNTRNYLSAKMLIWQKPSGGGTSRLYYFGTSNAYGSANQTVSASYRSQDSLGVGALKKVGEDMSTLTAMYGFIGRIYSAAFGYERCYAPVIYGGKAGLYDLLTDTFHDSETMYDFVAGPLI